MGALFGGLGWEFSVVFQALHLTFMQYVGLSVFCILIGLDLKVWSYSAGKPGDVIRSAILGTLGDTAYVAGSDSKTGPKPKGTGAHNLKIEEKAKQVKDGTIVSCYWCSCKERNRSYI